MPRTPRPPGAQLQNQNPKNTLNPSIVSVGPSVALCLCASVVPSSSCLGALRVFAPKKTKDSRNHITPQKQQRRRKPPPSKNNTNRTFSQFLRGKPPQTVG